MNSYVTVIDGRDTIVQPFRIRVLWSQAIVKSDDSHLARCSQGITESSTTVDMEKMELIVFDPIHHGYIELGKTIGKAFSDGKTLK